MVKHTQTMSLFDYFVWLALTGLNQIYYPLRPNFNFRACVEVGISGKMLFTRKYFQESQSLTTAFMTSYSDPIYRRASSMQVSN